MRGQQLSEIARKALGSDFEINYSALNRSYRNQILYLTKGAIQASSLKKLDDLSKKKNTLIFDPVDAVLDDQKMIYANVVVASSRIAFADYSEKYKDKKVVLLDHHVDPRINGLDWAHRPVEFRAAYFGEIVNTFSTSKIRREVEFIRVDTSRQESGWLEKLPDYNLHYAIRRGRAIDGHKPFLKGFTAAHCGANILIQSSEKEALLWLGEDYPYLLKGDVTEKKILLMLEKARSDFGSLEWRRALDIMKEIKEKTSEESIAKQLIELFK